MDISGSRILLLGGAGLVGMAIARRLIKHHKPKTIIITSLFESEVEQAIVELQPMAGETELISSHGNVFVREEFKGLGRHDILDNEDRIKKLIVF